MQRTLSLDVFDYAGHALCNLYDSTNDIVGQAHDVAVHTERNGFKELRFNLPSTCLQKNVILNESKTEVISETEKETKNYRLDFLISDYKIRFREVKNGVEEIDWFLISENKVTHSAFSTDYEVRAGHISQLLNTKNLNLEFSDDEGNNTGTIKQTAAVILDGTGWHLGAVAEFREEDKYDPSGKEKVRSFNASAKTGAFKMMNDLCEMFDAKPVYHGEGEYVGHTVIGTDPNGVVDAIYGTDYDAYEVDRYIEKAEREGWTDVTAYVQQEPAIGRTVDILPINPFSEKLEDGMIPPDLDKSKVIELHYDKNISNVVRTLNTDNMVTVLSAYGSYGDRNGLCSLQNAEHAEIMLGSLISPNPYTIITVTAENGTNTYAEANKEAEVIGHLNNGSEAPVVLNIERTWAQIHNNNEEAPAQFVCMEDAQVTREKEPFYYELSAGNYKFTYQQANYYFSTDITTQNLKWSALDFVSRSYVYDGEHLFEVYKEPQTGVTYAELSVESNYVKNKIPYIMDFSYYRKVNLLSDNMLLELAQAQYVLPSKHIAAEEASVDMSEIKDELSRTASSGNGFLMLDVAYSNKDINDHCVLTLNKNVYKDAVIFRSDYDESKRNYFSWNVATGIKANGEAINAAGAVIYIVHQDLSSYVDEHDNIYYASESVQFDDYNHFPATGTTYVAYIDIAEDKTYIWSEGYIEVSFVSSKTKWEKSYVKALGNGTDNYYQDNFKNIYELHTEIHRDRKEYAPEFPDATYFPQTGEPDVIYVADNTTQCYLWKDDEYIEINARGYYYDLNEYPEPTTITLWTTSDTWDRNAKVYLFSADAIAGVFGPREDSIYANRKSAQEAIKNSTEIHPLTFIQEGDPIPPVSECYETYGWYYKSYLNTYELGDLHFCWGKNGDLVWSNVYIDNGFEDPENIRAMNEYYYYYSLRRSMAYITSGNSYAPLNKTVDEQAITKAFAAIIDSCINQEMLTKGVSEKYVFDVNDSGNRRILHNDRLPFGNYAFVNEYNNYWLFSTTINIRDLSLIRYESDSKNVWQDSDSNHVLKAKEYSFRSLEFPKYNELIGTTFSQMGYENRTFLTDGDKYVSNNIYVHSRTQYEFELPEGAIVVCLGENQKVLSEVHFSPFTTPDHTTHIRVVSSDEIESEHYIHVVNFDRVFFVKNEMFYVLKSVPAGEKLGITYLMDKFVRLAHEAYQVKLPILQAVQQEITDINLHLANTLGDMYREGYWQENNYVESDEDKLYSDAKDNLKEISHPQATYEYKFLDLYEVDDVGSEIKVSYPDIDTEYAVHLVDPDIDINKWAYIDKIDKCYDQPWKTQIEINTRLSMIGQQSFTDVLAKIAEVANETKAKQTIYAKAEGIGNAGQLAADKLEGLIQANKIYLMGGTSNWYTDNKGNIIFEDADGNSAMMLTGRGLCISNSKDVYGDWDWRTALSGKGFNADVITTGEFSAKHITAGTITTDKLSSNVGQELEIGSNKALTLYATVDGNRPVDGFVTKHPDPGDSYIRITAETEDTPAYIDVQSGGKVNLYGGSSINIESAGLLNMQGSTIDIHATDISSLPEWTANTNYIKDQVVKKTSIVEGEQIVKGYKCKEDNNDAEFDEDNWEEYDGIGKVVIESGGSINIKSGSEFLVNSENFKIQQNEHDPSEYDVTVKGHITTTGGKIAGFTIGKTNDLIPIDYMAAGKTSLNAEGTGIYIGTNGINIADKFIFDNQLGGLAKLKVNAADITLGDVGPSGKTLSAKFTEIDEKIAETNTTFVSTTEDMIGESYAVGDTWTCLDEINGECYYYIYRAMVTRTNATAQNIEDDWELTGTALTAGASLKINASSGTIDMVAANTINIASGANLNIAAGEQLCLLAGNSTGTQHSDPTGSGGSVLIGNSSNPFTIDADYYIYQEATQEQTAIEYYRAFIRNGAQNNGVQNIKDTTHQGIYLGTDGINVRSANYSFLFDLNANNGAVFNVDAANVSLGQFTLSQRLDRAESMATGAALKIDTNVGTINMDAGNTINIKAGANINIESEQKLRLLVGNVAGENERNLEYCGGEILIGTASSPFTIGSDYYTASVSPVVDRYPRTYMYNGKANIQDLTHTGIYIGTDGINIGTANGSYVVATANGNVSISGNISASTGAIASFAISNGKLYTNGKSSIDAAVSGVYLSSNGIGIGVGVIDGVSRSKFKVTDNGELYAYDAYISGGINASYGKIANLFIDNGVRENETMGGWIGACSVTPQHRFYSTYGMGEDYTGVIGNKAYHYPVFWAGASSAGGPNSAPFCVFGDGSLYATNAHLTNASISGTITSASINTASITAGSISCWNFNQWAISRTYPPPGGTVETWAYGLGFGESGVYTGFWIGSSLAKTAPLAMVVNRTLSTDAAYSLTASQYWWAIPNGGGTWKYRKFDLQKLYENYGAGEWVP